MSEEVNLYNALQFYNGAVERLERVSGPKPFLCKHDMSQESATDMLGRAQDTLDGAIERVLGMDLSVFYGMHSGLDNSFVEDHLALIEPAQNVAYHIKRREDLNKRGALLRHHFIQDGVKDLRWFPTYNMLCHELDIYIKEDPVVASHIVRFPFGQYIAFSRAKKYIGRYTVGAVLGSALAVATGAISVAPTILLLQMGVDCAFSEKNIFRRRANELEKRAKQVTEGVITYLEGPGAERHKQTVLEKTA
jgi:hypothetical protein